MSKDGTGERRQNEGGRRSDDRYRYGEYYMEPTPEDVRQNHRLKAIESSVDGLKNELTGVWKSVESLKGVDRELEVALIGKDGNNGIRGTMMAHYEQVHLRIDDLTETVKEMDRTVIALTVEVQSLIKALKMAGKLIAGTATLATIVWLGVQIWEHFTV